MTAPSADPTRRERVAQKLYVDAMPPRGQKRTSRFGVGLVLLALLVVASALLIGLGSPELIPSVLAVTALLYGLYVMYDLLGGT